MHGHAPQPKGTSRTYALRRLRATRPDIHTRVLAGELSPHKGMLEAGFRHQPTPLDTLHTVWRKLSPDDRMRFLIKMLTLQSGERSALGSTRRRTDPYRSTPPKPLGSGSYLALGCIQSLPGDTKCLGT